MIDWLKNKGLTHTDSLKRNYARFPWIKTHD